MDLGQWQIIYFMSNIPLLDLAQLNLKGFYYMCCTLVFMWQQFEPFQNKESTLWTPTQIYLLELQAKYITAMKVEIKA